jgi:hypothetical protein
MCEHGDSVSMNVPIPADLSHTGTFRWAVKPVDRCIAPIIRALNVAGIYTANACCGHGKVPGVVVLHDGRELVVKTGYSFTPSTVGVGKAHEQEGCAHDV